MWPCHPTGRGWEEGAGEGAGNKGQGWWRWMRSTTSSTPRLGTDESHSGPARPDASAQVLATFMKDGRITQIPRQHAKRRVLLDVLAQEFEPGLRYSEQDVNETLARFHPDTAALRRY